jgi:hypothetical protein
MFNLVACLSKKNQRLPLMQKIISTIGAFCLFAIGLAAQKETSSLATSTKVTVTPTAPQEIDWEKFDEYVAATESEARSEMVFVNQENRVMFIDLAQVQEQSGDSKPLQRIYVWSAAKELAFYDDALSSLSQDAIYEVDLRQLPSGTYTVELYKSKENIVHFELIWQ